jgi:hypothetical protein
VRLTHGACGASWNGNGVAHCGGCHHNFSGVGLFDRHRGNTGPHGTCTPPDQLRTTTGERVCELRDNVWRYPEMTEAQKLARFGETKAG